MLRFAFSSNAFKKVDVFEAARQIASVGYAGMEVMADVPHAYPPDFSADQRRRLVGLLRELGLAVSNVNAFTLFARGDTYHPSWIEHDPEARRVRVDHTIAAVELAAEIGAPSVSIQPGGPLIGTGLTRDQASRRLADGIEAVLPTATRCGITLAIEPEPGLLLQSISEYLEFKTRFFGQETRLAMNCDLGHLFCVGDDPATVIRRYGDQIAHIHLEDIGRNHVHQHLPLGEGAMDIPGILNALTEAQYAGWVTVELYPYVSTPTEVARRAMGYLQTIQSNP